MEKKIYGIMGFALLAFALPVCFIQAHETGASWEKIVGGYGVDIGYDPADFIAGQPQRFDFSLENEKTGESADFSDVWVRISLDKETVFAGGIHQPSFGKAGMTFVFPKAGEYLLSIRFEDGDKNLAETAFPVSVGVAGEAKANAVQGSSGFVKLLLSGLVGILIGAGAAWIMMKKSK